MDTIQGYALHTSLVLYLNIIIPEKSSVFPKSFINRNR